MEIINLDAEFTPYGDNTINFEKLMFPSRIEPHIKIKNKINTKELLITTRIKSMDDLMLLLLTTDVLKRNNVEKINVFIPYLPFARQDRQTTVSEPFSIKVFSNIINQQNYSKIMIYDVHSDVSLALLDNVYSIKNYLFVRNVLIKQDNFLIVVPDAGAYKKILNLCDFLMYREKLIVCNKIRDVKNGDITISIPKNIDIKNRNIFIIDDICSKGGTFKAIAKELKKQKCKNISLIISHYENSANIKELQESGINTIYTTNSMCDIDSDYIIQTKLSERILDEY